MLDYSIYHGVILLFYSFILNQLWALTVELEMTKLSPSPHCEVSLKKKNLDPDNDPDPLFHFWHFLNISSKSIHNLFHFLANRQAGTLTDKLHPQKQLRKKTKTEEWRANIPERTPRQCSSLTANYKMAWYFVLDMNARVNRLGMPVDKGNIMRARVRFTTLADIPHQNTVYT